MAFDLSRRSMNAEAIEKQRPAVRQAVLAVDRLYSRSFHASFNPEISRKN